MKKENIRWIIVFILIGILSLSFLWKEEDDKKSETSYSYDKEYIDSKKKLHEDAYLNQEVANSAYKKVLAIEEEKRLRAIKEQETKKKAELEKKKNEVQVSRNNSSEVSYESYFEVTFYSNDYASTGKSKGDPYYGITASGAKSTLGVTVACPKSMPFGTKLHIEGFGYRICQDRGSAITQGRLDIFVSSEKEAYALGRKKLLVKVFNKE